VLQYRKFREYVDQRLTFEPDMPPPTPRTRHSSFGMAQWEKFVKEEHRQERVLAGNYRDPWKRAMGGEDFIVHDAFLAFDHKVYFLHHSLVFWHTFDLKWYFPDQVPLNDPTEQPVARHDLVTSDELTLF
jgi:hypothetical protein